MYRICQIDQLHLDFMYLFIGIIVIFIMRSFYNKYILYLGLFIIYIFFVFTVNKDFKYACSDGYILYGL